MGVSAEKISQVAEQGLHRSTATETEKQSTLKLGVRGANGVRSLAPAMSYISGHFWPFHFTCEINSVNCLIDCDFWLVLQLSLLCTQPYAKHFCPSLYSTWHTEMPWPLPNRAMNKAAGPRYSTKQLARDIPQSSWPEIFHKAAGPRDSTN